jgi:hypothetical protein
LCCLFLLQQLCCQRLLLLQLLRQLPPRRSALLCSLPPAALRPPVAGMHCCNTLQVTVTRHQAPKVQLFKLCGCAKHLGQNPKRYIQLPSQAQVCEVTQRCQAGKTLVLNPDGAEVQLG